MNENEIRNNPRNVARNGNPVSRRDFMKHATAATALGAVSAVVHSCKGGMKYRTLGRTGLKISVINSDELPDKKMYEMAIKLGINYWHKMGRWGEPDIFRKLDRDSFYCDLTIDSIEKQTAIEEFERGLKRSQLSMIEGFKVHSVYKTPEEIKTKTGMLRAFETLKKQGKTRFLMLSQHTNVFEVTEAAIESDLFDVIQIPIHPLAQYGSKGPNDKNRQVSKTSLDEYIGLIKKAADKKIGITSMKTLVGGPQNWEKITSFHERVGKYLPDNESVIKALIHWVLDIPGVSSVASNMRSFEMFKENMEAVAGELTDNDLKGLACLSDVMDKAVCRMCGKCEYENPRGVAVSDILRYSMYFSAYGDRERARALYLALPLNRKVHSTADIKRYEKSCPYKLPLEQMLSTAHRTLS